MPSKNQQTVEQIGKAQRSLPLAFDPEAVEAGMYDRWDAAGYFAPTADPGAKPFVVVMPPPNVTGELHVGHALFVALEDLMIRWHRMKGDASGSSNPPAQRTRHARHAALRCRSVA